MPDGTRKRRFSLDQAKRKFYSDHRSERWDKLMNNGGFAKIAEMADQWQQRHQRRAA